MTRAIRKISTIVDTPRAIALDDVSIHNVQRAVGVSGYEARCHIRGGSNFTSGNFHQTERNSDEERENN